MYVSREPGLEGLRGEGASSAQTASELNIRWILDNASYRVMQNANMFLFCFTIVHSMIEL